MTLSLLVGLLLALILLWSASERSFKLRFSQMGSTASWDRKMALLRRHNSFNTAVALSTLAILGGLVFTSYQYQNLVLADDEPPEIRTAPLTAAAADGVVLRWTAVYPGGRLWAAAGDAGYVLSRGIRGKYDQYFLHSASGNLLWSGSRVLRGPAPRAALMVVTETAYLAIETESGPAEVLVFVPGQKPAPAAPLEAFPAGEDLRWYALKDDAGVVRERRLSPDGRWRVESRTGLGVDWLVTSLKLYGPLPH